MKVLCLIDDTALQAWLVDLPADQAGEVIANGYPHLLEGYQAGTVLAAEIDVPDEEAFRADLYEITAGESGPEVTRKQGV